MSEVVYITGHKNPDSDSICSALAYAEYKNLDGNINAIPVRLGKINRETKFILEYFNMEAPMLLETVRLSVEDLDFDKIAPVSPDISLRMTLDIMKENDINSIPVVGENEELLGIITISDIIQSYIDVWDNNILGKSKASIDNIIDTLSAKPITIPNNLSTFNGKILVLAMEPESAEEYMEKEDIIICGNRKDAQKLAIRKKASLMILSGNTKVDEEIVKLAKENNVAIISTPHDTFTASRLLAQSVPISHVMTKDDIVKFDLDDLVDDIKVQMSQTRYRSYPIIDNHHNNRVVGLISRYHLISSTKKKVILVDHNERSQSVDGLEECEILEIIDHHRVADVFTGTPIYFRNEPVGSTATIIGSIYFENGRRPSKKIAGILSAAIISDTLLFRSPTSTNTDKIMLKRLSRIADIDVDKFAMEMFKAGTSLVGKTPAEMLSQDFKEFTIKEEKLGVAQVYTMDPDSLKDMKSELIESMENRLETDGYSIFVLMLTDIFNQASEIVMVGKNKELVAEGFGEKLVDNSFYAPGVLSRKKQVVPPITNTLINIQELELS